METAAISLKSAYMEEDLRVSFFYIVTISKTMFHDCQ